MKGERWCTSVSAWVPDCSSISPAHSTLPEPPPNWTVSDWVDLALQLYRRLADTALKVCANIAIVYSASITYHVFTALSTFLMAFRCREDHASYSLIEPARKAVSLRSTPPLHPPTSQRKDMLVVWCWMERYLPWNVNASFFTLVCHQDLRLLKKLYWWGAGGLGGWSTPSLLAIFFQSFFSVRFPFPLCSLSPSLFAYAFCLLFTVFHSFVGFL